MRRLKEIKIDFKMWQLKVPLLSTEVKKEEKC